MNESHQTQWRWKQLDDRLYVVWKFGDEKNTIFFVRSSKSPWDIFNWDSGKLILTP